MFRRICTGVSDGCCGKVGGGNLTSASTKILTPPNPTCSSSVSISPSAHAFAFTHNAAHGLTPLNPTHKNNTPGASGKNQKSNRMFRRICAGVSDVCCGKAGSGNLTRASTKILTPPNPTCSNPVSISPSAHAFTFTHNAAHGLTPPNPKCSNPVSTSPSAHAFTFTHNAAHGLNPPNPTCPKSKDEPDILCVITSTQS